MNNLFVADQYLDLLNENVYDDHEGLIAEASAFEARHRNSRCLDERLLSDLLMLCLRFGRNSDVAYALTKQRCSQDSVETAFWFMSHITLEIELINDTCRAVDGLLRLVDNAPDPDLAEEARCLAEDFSMEQPDDVRIELKFSIPPTRQRHPSKSLSASTPVVASSV
jgi:hypothetical protein